MRGFKPSCLNRLDQPYFVIWPNLLSKIILSPKMCGDMVSKFNYQHDHNGHVTEVLTIFIRQHGPLPASSLTCLFVSPGCVPCAIFAVAEDIFLMKQQLFSCLLRPRGGGGGGSERQW